MDTLTPKQRSDRMARVRSRDTKPEMAVRRLVHGLGYRYRLHQRVLSTRPDLVFRSRRKVIFVHGCFWHLHDCKNGQRTPKSRVEFWTSKREGNAARDARVRLDLEEAGWGVLVVWECEIRDQERLVRRLTRFLEG